MIISHLYWSWFHWLSQNASVCPFQNQKVKDTDNQKNSRENNGEQWHNELAFLVDVWQGIAIMLCEYGATGSILMWDALTDAFGNLDELATIDLFMLYFTTDYEKRVKV